MIRVFEALNFPEANYVCGLLQAAGIEAELRGDTLFSFVGAGTQVPGVLPAVWIAHREDEPRARELVARYQGGSPVRGAAWTCPSCAEAHEPQFTTCWKCGAERPG